MAEHVLFLVHIIYSSAERGHTKPITADYCHKRTTRMDRMNNYALRIIGDEGIELSTTHKQLFGDKNR